MYIVLKIHTSFESEVQLVSDLKHDVVAEHWAMLIKEHMESGMTVRNGVITGISKSPGIFITG